MQVHSRRPLIAVLLDPSSQEQSSAPCDLSRPLSWWFSLLCAVSMLLGWMAGLFASQYPSEHTARTAKQQMDFREAVLPADFSVSR